MTTDRNTSWIRDKYSTLFHFNEELRKLVESKWQKMNLGMSAVKGVVSFALGKGHKTHEAVLILCERGFGQDAAMLVRTLFELAVTVAYIKKENSEYRAKRFLNYDWILRKRMYDYAIKNEEYKSLLTEAAPEGGIDELMRTADEIQKEYKFDRRFGWSDKSIRRMAQDVNLLSIYETVYGLHSNLVHSAPRTANDYVSSPDEQDFTIQTGQSEKWVEESLVTAFHFYGIVVDHWQNTFEVDMKDEFEKLTKDYVEAVGKTG
ncbi:MAG: hypothetical protein A3A51_00040 [Candidatus Levybacteria bacterium RIFCSPLOWO2_01_FULL_39_10]|nr:MAG: hypothetical protein A3A51_00040 [Candidatus Levybacteria bacterium RIFCSPLOWO2_01_FULL_39_10]